MAKCTRMLSPEESDLVKDFMKRGNITQSYLAKQTGVSTSYWSPVLAGAKLMNQHRAQQLYTALGSDPSMLFLQEWRLQFCPPSESTPANVSSINLGWGALFQSYFLQLNPLFLKQDLTRKTEFLGELETLIVKYTPPAPHSESPPA